MSLARSCAVCVALQAASGALLADGPQVPDDFEQVSATAANAFVFAKQCLPSVSEAAFTRMVIDASDKGLALSRAADRSKPYLVVTSGRAYCVRISGRNYPLLPLRAFEETVDFTDMPAEETRRLRSDLSRQLAASGFATAMVVNAAGNGVQLAYLLSSDAPTKLYYHANFLRSGEFAEGAHATLYRTPGGMSVVARGQPAEHVKFLFARSGATLANPAPRPALPSRGRMEVF